MSLSSDNVAFEMWVPSNSPLLELRPDQCFARSLKAHLKETKKPHLINTTIFF